MGAGVGVASLSDPNHSAGYVLVGASTGALLGTATLIGTLQPQDRPFDRLGHFALPMLGAGVGALIGYAVPTGTSVALTPLDGGASAHVGFTF